MEQSNLYAYGIAAVSFIIAVLSLIVSMIINKRTLFVNTITSNRINWITNLREDISIFCGNTLNYALGKYDNDQQAINKIREENDKLRYKIKLYLNRKEDNHEKLIGLIDDIIASTDKPSIKTKLNETTELSQDILKEAWDKMKKEAQTGKASKY